MNFFLISAVYVFIIIIKMSKFTATSIMFNECLPLDSCGY